MTELNFNNFITNEQLKQNTVIKVLQFNQGNCWNKNWEEMDLLWR